MADDDFGYTAWGRDWVRLAQPLHQTRPDPRLPRARALARASGMQLTVDGPQARGVVPSGRNTFLVCIDVAPMSRETVSGITGHFGGARPILTDEFHSAITQVGHPPAPILAAVACSCSDDTGRCLHTLAVLYAMARRVDDDPRIALDIQGYFRVSSESSGVSSAEPQRWTALGDLDPADYFRAANQ